jgi:hypothetical protein
MGYSVRSDFVFGNIPDHLRGFRFHQSDESDHPRVAKSDRVGEVAMVTIHKRVLGP